MLLLIGFCTLLICNVVFLWLSALNQSRQDGKVVPGEEAVSKQHRVDPRDKTSCEIVRLEV